MSPPTFARFRFATGLALVAAGVLLVTTLDGPSRSDQFRTLVPLAAVALGMTVLLRDVDAARHALAPDAPVRRSTTRLRAAAGVVIIAGSLVRLLTNGASVAEETSAVIAAFLLFVGAVLAVLPYILRIVQELGVERAERIRAQEHAEVAAHMHDSVLHTLTLIQRADPADVPRLARAQERELRAWLYDRRDGAAGGAAAERTERFAEAVKAAAAEVEDRYGVRIEVVAVGDTELDDALRAAVAAAREAMVNAAKYAGGATDAPISVYAEAQTDDASARRVEVYVRDRGPGFELEGVAADRMGIRESIVGRMTRHGGRAVIRTAPGEGTEVRLEVRRERGEG